LRTYIIIDIDYTISSILESVLDDYTALLSVGFFSSYDDALNAILKLKPDVVFYNLDIERATPFKIVNELNNYVSTPPNFVGISHSQKLAYEALKNNFLDYLLTPLTELEVRKSILKFKKKDAIKSTRTICLKSYKDYKYINIDEILYLKADNNSTDFYLSCGKVISAFKTLKTFEDRLPNNFLRIHKSYIINKDYISRINYGKLSCTLDNSLHKIPFTRTYLDNIESITKTLSSISIVSKN